MHDPTNDTEATGHDFESLPVDEYEAARAERERKERERKADDGEEDSGDGGDDFRSAAAARDDSER